MDPWRPATPHSDYANDRDDTILRPFKIIPSAFAVVFPYVCADGLSDAVHHYDEWGYKKLSDEPEEIRKIHGEMILFVLEWLKDWVSPLNKD